MMRAKQYLHLKHRFQREMKLLEGFAVGGLCPPNPPLGLRPIPRFGSICILHEYFFLLNNAHSKSG